MEYQDKHSDLIEEVAKASNVEPAQVQAVLEQLGLPRSLETLAQSGGDISRVTADNLKVAVRFGGGGGTVSV